MLSKYAWVVPLKNKTGKSLVEAFDHIFKQDERIPERLQTDKGTEFTNRQFQTFLESKHVIILLPTVKRKPKSWNVLTEPSKHACGDILLK